MTGLKIQHDHGNYKSTNYNSHYIVQKHWITISSVAKSVYMSNLLEERCCCHLSGRVLVHGPQFLEFVVQSVVAAIGLPRKVIGSNTDGDEFSLPSQQRDQSVYSTAGTGFLVESGVPS